MSYFGTDGIRGLCLGFPSTDFVSKLGYGDRPGFGRASRFFKEEAECCDW